MFNAHQLQNCAKAEKETNRLLEGDFIEKINRKHQVFLIKLK